MIIAPLALSHARIRCTRNKTLAATKCSLYILRCTHSHEMPALYRISTFNCRKIKRILEKHYIFWLGWNRGPIGFCRNAGFKLFKIHLLVHRWLPKFFGSDISTIHFGKMVLIKFSGIHVHGVHLMRTLPLFFLSIYFIFILFYLFFSITDGWFSHYNYFLNFPNV